MDLQLSGRTALVTGATKGIGRAIADLFAAEGASVAICARDADAVSETVASLARVATRASGRALDVADAAAVRSWVDATAQEFGGIDMIVGNVSALAVNRDEAAWRAGFATDILGSVALVDAAMPYLERSAAGSITLIASVSGREIDFAAGPYGALKAALIHYAQGLAHQLAPRGLRANSVSPGNTYFPGGVWARIERDNPDLFASALALNPTGRMGTPEEVARAVVFLASPAASFINGINLVVDGALTRGVQF